MTAPPVDEVAARVVEAVAKAGLPLATRGAEEFQAIFSVICRRAGDRLEIHPSSERTAFAAMAHAEPTFHVSLAGTGPTDEPQVLRRAARQLEAGDRHAIPFVLLRGGGRPRGGERVVCGASVRPPFEPVFLLVGHGQGAAVPLEVIMVGRERLVVFGLDSHSDRFGGVVLDEPTKALTRIDLDDRTLGLRIAEREFAWRLEASASEDDKASSLRLARELGVPLRRFARVDATTRQLAPHEGD